MQIIHIQSLVVACVILITTSRAAADYQYCEEAAIDLAGAPLGKACEKIDTPNKLICAIASLKAGLGIRDACVLIRNEHEAACAAASLEKKKTIDSACKDAKKLGIRCVIESLRAKGDISPLCLRVQNDRQDRCLAAFYRSAEKFASKVVNFNYDDISDYCLKLNESKKIEKLPIAPRIAPLGSMQNPIRVPAPRGRF